MVEQLQAIDAQAFTAVNSLHATYFDSLMWLISAKLAWIPMILCLLYILWRKNWRTLAFVVLALAFVILLSDQLSSGIIKPIVERLRPSRNPDLAATIHLVNGYKGGMYGFVSSHAANSFGVAVLMILLFRNRIVTLSLMMWAVLVCYCRIYLGVHYPGDIVCGALCGTLMAFIVYRLEGLIQIRFATGANLDFSRNDAKLMGWSVVANFAILAIYAIIYVP